VTITCFGQWHDDLGGRDLGSILSREPLPKEGWFKAWVEAGMDVGPLDVVTIQVRDWDAAVSWYTEMLGLTVVVREDDHRFCMLQTGGAMLALATDHPEHASSTGENRIAPSFQVGDLDAAVARLSAAGVKVDPELDGGHEAYRLARIWDLEGNRINLYTYG
jgi:catechol 2,3-dioxygenase-like lactoylglutathione lyase family enzyme